MRVLLTVALLFSACASTEGNRYPQTSESRPGLSSGDLAAGECGLFVWRKDEAKTFLIFSSVRESRIYIDEEFTFTPADDPLSPEQDFRADDRDWTLRLSEPKTIANGTRFDAGTLRTVTDGGWELIVSVIGLTLCNETELES